MDVETLNQKYSLNFPRFLNGLAGEILFVNKVEKMAENSNSTMKFKIYRAKSEKNRNFPNNVRWKGRKLEAGG